MYVNLYHETGQIVNFLLTRKKFSNLTRLWYKSELKRRSKVTVSQAQSLVYSFGPHSPPLQLDKTILGGKGMGLAEMSAIHIPVPPGFIISTEACNLYKSNSEHFPDGLDQRVYSAMKVLEQETGFEFGSGKLIHC